MEEPHPEKPTVLVLGTERDATRVRYFIGDYNVECCPDAKSAAERIRQGGIAGAIVRGSQDGINFVFELNRGKFGRENEITHMPVLVHSTEGKASRTVAYLNSGDGFLLFPNGSAQGLLTAGESIAKEDIMHLKDVIGDIQREGTYSVFRRYRPDLFPTGPTFPLPF